MSLKLHTPWDVTFVYLDHLAGDHGIDVGLVVSDIFRRGGNGETIPFRLTQLVS